VRELAEDVNMSEFHALINRSFKEQVTRDVAWCNFQKKLRPCMSAQAENCSAISLDTPSLVEHTLYV